MNWSIASGVRACAQRGFTLVEAMVSCAVLAPILIVTLSATAGISRSMSVSEARAAASARASSACRRIADLIQPASVISLRIVNGSTWTAPLDDVNYTKLRFQPLATMGNGGAMVLGNRLELGFALARGEYGNTRDDNGNGLIDEGNVYLVMANGTRTEIVPGIERFQIRKSGRNLTITVRTGVRDKTRIVHRSTQSLTVSLRNN